MSAPPENPSGLVSLTSWTKHLGLSRTTIHRWRKKFGWFKCVNIYGKVYVCRESIEEFERRAIAGEFARDVHPSNGKAVH
jgi:predicted site-specific integrase-resolvase